MKSIEAKTYDEALTWLRDNGFDITEAPGMSGGDPENSRRRSEDLCLPGLLDRQ
jgi:hypothetical protein